MQDNAIAALSLFLGDIVTLYKKDTDQILANGELEGNDYTFSVDGFTFDTGFITRIDPTQGGAAITLA